MFRLKGDTVTITEYDYVGETPTEYWIRVKGRAFCVPKDSVYVRKGEWEMKPVVITFSSAVKCGLVLYLLALQCGIEY